MEEQEEKPERNEKAGKALQAEAGLDQGTEGRRQLSWGQFGDCSSR